MTSEASSQSTSGNSGVSNAEAVEAEVVPPRRTYITKQGAVLTPWVKGQSGNPGGIGGRYLEARKLCADKAPEAAEKLIALMNDPDTRVAFMAAEAVLNRGVGKPRDHSADDAAATRVDISALSADERNSLAVLLKKALGIR